MTSRVMVYSHDTFGMGNIRRMLAVSEHLLDSVSNCSVLLVTGSPIVHEFRAKPGLDYIKLPCLSRTGREEYTTKSLGTDITQTIQMRSNLIRAAARDFEPDVVLIDKKPDGVKQELQQTLLHLKENLPETRIGLVLRDILDDPATTTSVWSERDYWSTIRRFYSSVLILGDKKVFDARAEYRFPRDIRRMSTLCGYTRRSNSAENASIIRQAVLRTGKNSLVLVTPGGGEDGYALVEAYLASLPFLPNGHDVQSLIVCGPEMPAAHLQAIRNAAQGNDSITVLEFTGDMGSYMAAADVTVTMAGYNTVCEVLSFAKRAILVPRVRPVPEQHIRAERMSRLGLFTTLHPDYLTPVRMAEAVQCQLAQVSSNRPSGINLDGLTSVSTWVSQSLRKRRVLSLPNSMEVAWTTASPTF
jgi:predicted glycosyltransferase